MTDFYTNRHGQRIAIRPSTSRQELGEDHMTLFARLARMTGSTPNTANCMHGTPGERKHKS